MLLGSFQRWHLLVELVTPCTVATSLSSLAALHALVCCFFSTGFPAIWASGQTLGTVKHQTPADMPCHVPALMLLQVASISMTQLCPSPVA